MTTKRWKTRTASALAAGALALAATACGGQGADAPGPEGSPGGGTPTTVSVWHGFTEADGKVIDAIAKEFNSSQSDYKVEIEVNPWNVITDKLLPAMKSGNGPDIVVQGVDSGPGYAKQGVFVDTQAFYDNPAYETDTYFEHVVDYGRIDGKPYAIPMGYAPFAVWYNKAMFEAAGVTDFPKTWDEWIDLAEKLTIDDNGDGTPEIYGLAISDKATTFIPTWLKAGGGAVYSDGEVTLNTPQNVATLQWWADAYKRGWGPTNVTLPEAVDLFKAGKAAMTVIGPWIISGAESVGLEIGVFEVPKGPERIAAQAAANYWWVTSAADEAATKGAYEFLAYFNSHDSQVRWAVEANYPPNRKDVTEAEVAANPYIATMLPFTTNTYVRLAGLPGGLTDVNTELDTLSIGISEGKGDVAQLVAKADEAIRGIVSEYQ